MSAVQEELPAPKGVSIAAPLGDAIDVLAKIWRETHDPSVATKLVALSTAFGGFFRRLPKKGPLFGKLAALRSDRMLDVLLRSITRCGDLSAANRLRAVFGAWGADPRIWPFLDRWTSADTYYLGCAFHGELENAINGWEQRRANAAAATRPVTDADRAELVRADALLASLPKRRATLGLLNEVYAHPADMERRLVLADALMELGDPWGELIAIQCRSSASPPSSIPSSGRASPSQREAELLDEHGTLWLGRLARWVREDTVVFEGGFPATLALQQNARATGLVEWSTVREIVDRYQRASPELGTLALLPRMPRLRSVSMTLVAVAGQIPRLRYNAGVEQLTIRLFPIDAAAGRQMFESWARVRPFPRLEQLHLVQTSWNQESLDALLVLLDAPFARGLRVLGLNAPLSFLLERSAGAIAAGRTLPSVRSFPDLSSFDFDAKARALTLKLGARVNMSAIGDVVRRASLASLRVEAVKIAWPTVESRQWRNGFGDLRLDLVRA